MRLGAGLAALKNLCRGTIDTGFGRFCERAFVLESEVTRTFTTGKMAFQNAPNV